MPRSTQTFDHNGIFHLVQMPALVLLALGLGIALRARPAAERRSRSIAPDASAHP